MKNTLALIAAFGLVSTAAVALEDNAAKVDASANVAVSDKIVKKSEEKAEDAAQAAKKSAIDAEAAAKVAPAAGNDEDEAEGHNAH